MAHIPDGVLSLPILVGGGLAAVTALSFATRRLDYERIPQAALLAAAFFVASLVNVPIGPSSVHLILNGLMGLLLGWTAVPAIVVALLMQAVFFGYGGLLVLGVNAFNIAAPALLCGLLIAPWLQRADGRQVFMIGACAGGVSVMLTGGLVCGSLMLSGPEFLPAGKVILLTYLPLMLVEAAVTGAALVLIKRVAPEFLAVGQR